MRVTTTYSRKTKRLMETHSPEASPLKRQRLHLDDTATPSSSTERWASSSPRPITSPPSSPPPALRPKPNDAKLNEIRQPVVAPPRRKLRMARRRVLVGERRPLEDVVDENALRPSNKPLASRKFTQLQIDLGGDTRRTCNTCGMEYIPSNADDAALHKAFHAGKARGIHVGKNLGKSGGLTRRTGRGREGQWSNSILDDDGRIAIVCRSSTAVEKEKAMMAMETVNVELSATDLDEKSLWSQVSIRPRPAAGLPSATGASPVSTPRTPTSSTADRFRVYLYVRKEQCVGFCLAERITKAYEVVQQRATPGDKTVKSVLRSSSVSVGEVECPAILGISRIWISGPCRRQGIASRLLETARRTFIYGITIPMEAMAFSQPSESGKCLAEQWFGGQEGWKVYVED